MSVKGMILRIGLLLTVNAVSQAAETKMLARLTDVRYRPEAEYCRLVLGIEGSIQYSVDRLGTDLKVKLHNAKSAGYIAATQELSASGLLKRATVTSSGAGEITVGLQLAQDAEYSIIRPQGASVLWIDVFPARANDGGTSLAKGGGTGAVQTVSDYKRTKTGHMDPGSDTEIPKIAESPVALAVSLTIAVVGSILWFRFAVKPRLRNARKKNGPRAASAYSTKKVSDVPHKRDSVMHHGSKSFPLDAETSIPEFNPSVVRLAHAYQRGKVEVDLAMKFEQSRKKRPPIAGIKNVRREMLVAEGLHLAKNLGLGKGEVELAKTLGQLKSRTNRKEIIL